MDEKTEQPTGTSSEPISPDAAPEVRPGDLSPLERFFGEVDDFETSPPAGEEPVDEATAPVTGLDEPAEAAPAAPAPEPGPGEEASGATSEEGPPLPVPPGKEEEPPKAEEPKAEPAPAVDPAAQRAQLVEAVAKGYTYSEEFIEELTLKPEEALPKFAANIVVDAVIQTSQAIRTHLPALIAATMQQMKQAEADEAVFFGRWPDLKSHREKVRPIAAAYLQANPKASKDEFIKNVGAQAMVALGLVGQPAPSEAAKGKPPAPLQATPSAGPSAPRNPFTELAEEGW